jgi:hypothetical protein
MLKLMDVAAFATSFRKYDLLSQRWSAFEGHAQVPLGVVSFSENLIMALMGLAMAVAAQGRLRPRLPRA